MVLIHYTAMQTAQAALDRLCDPVPQVSAHYLISETGTVWQMVRDIDRAWHAGAGQWGDITDVNSHAIGIELANTGFHPFPEPQIQALEALLDDLMARWSILPQRVLGHSDTAPGRKIDPGGRFDWRRLALQGRAVWSDATYATDEQAFGTHLAQIGYDPDCAPDTLLAAFRARFHLQGQGPLNVVDLGRAADLATRFPYARLDVDRSPPVA